MTAAGNNPLNGADLLRSLCVWNGFGLNDLMSLQCDGSRWSSVGPFAQKINGV